MLAELQRALVGDDRPAIRRGDLRGVVLHRAEAVRHHVEEVAGGGVAQAVLHERRRLAHPALHDHAVALAGAAVAGRAEDVVAVLAARDQIRRHGHREEVGERAVDLARVEQLVVVGERIARHRVGHGHPGRLAVREERARLERLVPRRVVHVLAACRQRDARRDRERQRATETDQALRRNFGYSQRMKVLEKRLGRVAIELRIGRLDAEKEAIARRAGERRHVEHRVIRHRQPVERQHADKRRRATRRAPRTRTSPG